MQRRVTLSKRQPLHHYHRPLFHLWVYKIIVGAYLKTSQSGLPLHAWPPEAHPVAPSHVSALTSGVMLKVAVYGFIRFSFDLLGQIHGSWGVTVLVVGSVSALMGVLYALMQHDLKRLGAGGAGKPRNERQSAQHPAGDCACDRGEFGISYASCGAVENVIPVDAKIPGCPPDLLKGLLVAVDERHMA